jgi:hypothetical protein
MAPRASRAEAPTPERVAAEARVVAQLDAWRATAIPDPSAPLDAEALARLVRSCFDALGIDATVGADFSVHTVHYYRRKDIIDAPSGRTSAARYDLRHVWQAAGARLAGYLGLVTLAEARRVMRDADERTLVGFVASRVVDAHGRELMRRAAHVFPRSGVEPNVYSVMSVLESSTEARARPLPGVYGTAVSPVAPPEPSSIAAKAPADATVGADPATRHGVTSASVVRLPGDALCILPASHPAHHSPSSARELVRGLARALGLSIDVRASDEHEESRL